LSYSALKTRKTVIIESDEHDVFGDGTVIMKLAAGHTPGHQVLYVKLPKTGGVVLSGDLYHFPEARTLKRVATFDFDQAQTPSPGKPSKHSSLRVARNCGSSTITLATLGSRRLLITMGEPSAGVRTSRVGGERKAS
jgi:hypothetical protein